MPFAARWSQNIGCKAITTWLRRTPSEFSSFPANSRPRSHHPILSTYARKQIAVLNEQDQGADGAGAEDGRGKCRVGHAKRQPGFQESLLITPSVQAAHLSPPPTRGASSCARKSRPPPIRRPRTLSIFLEPADFSVVGPIMGTPVRCAADSRSRRPRRARVPNDNLVPAEHKPADADKPLRAEAEDSRGVGADNNPVVEAEDCSLSRSQRSRPRRRRQECPDLPRSRNSLRLH
jgi:hypothetical protein